ncbi:MAG TPA: YidC/Oxa1 family membrane protein insertase [Candidatus Saccharimonadales bacterium]|nr:YidC/Oxa1 family membrane protein insertase [Candidatus Saccharimonadales bacterium]
MNIFDILIVQPIFNLLIGIYSLIPGGDFGISLIIFTILVRFALFPLVKKQLHQTQVMKKLQPQLARIKKQAKGNKQLEGMQMLELYKQHGVSPFRSIGILLIQLPIFIALFQVIQIFTLHRDQIAKFSYDFLETLGPVKHLIEHPDQFNEKMFGFVDLTQTAFSNGSINFVLLLLAVVAAVTQYIMSKQTMPQAESKKGFREMMREAADGKSADQSEMNAVMMSKMVKILPFFMFFIMITVPGALALYYAVSNLVAVAQQSYLLKQDEEELEEIADKPAGKPGKKATAKAREKVAKSATVTRIVAKSTKKKGTK